MIADVLEPGEVVAGALVGRLVGLGNGDAVPVVLDDEDDRQLLARGAVDGLEEVALGGRRLADRAEDDRVLAVGLDRARRGRRRAARGWKRRRRRSGCRSRAWRSGWTCGGRRRRRRSPWTSRSRGSPRRSGRRRHRSRGRGSRGRGSPGPAGRSSRGRAGSRRARRRERGSSSPGPASGSWEPGRRGPGPGASARTISSALRATPRRWLARPRSTLVGSTFLRFRAQTLILTDLEAGFPSSASAARMATNASLLRASLRLRPGRGRAARDGFPIRRAAGRGRPPGPRGDAPGAAPPLRARAAAGEGLRRPLAADRPRPDDLAALRRRPDDPAARGRGRPQGARDRQRLRIPDGGPLAASLGRSTRSRGSTSWRAARPRRCARSAAATSRSRRSTERTAIRRRRPTTGSS